MEGPGLPRCTGVFDVERGQPGEIRADFWQTDTSVAKDSWGYTSNQTYKTAAGLAVTLPAQRPCNFAYTLKITRLNLKPTAHAEQAN
jgi:hypothetical protein